YISDQIGEHTEQSGLFCDFQPLIRIDNKKLSKVTVFFPDMETQKKIGDILFEVFQYQKQCPDTLQKKLLKEFEHCFIRQYITYPILCAQSKEGDYPCK
ncbi:hypothetical protein D3Z52_10165, partial [Clostridiaceae bacterium]|nr:hypothetical protein [Clostridiaceae bacterium]